MPEPIVLTSESSTPKEIAAAYEAHGLDAPTITTEDGEPAGDKQEASAQTETEGTEGAEGNGEVETEGEEGKTAGESETPSGQEKEERPRKGGVSPKIQARFDELTKKAKDNEREALDAKARADELERQLEEARKSPTKDEKKPEPVAEPVKPTAPVRPVPMSQFEGTVEEWEAKMAEYETGLVKYYEDLSDYKADQLKRELNAQRAVDTANSARGSAWGDKVDLAREEYADFDEASKVFSGTGDMKISPALFDGLFDSEIGGHVAYWLAKNPDEAKRIIKASSYDPKKVENLEVLKINRFVGREIAKIEAIIDAEHGKGKTPAGEKKTAEKTPAATPENKPPKKVSSAPPPIETKLSSKAIGTADDLATIAEERDMTKYRKARESGLGR